MSTPTSSILCGLICGAIFFLIALLLPTAYVYFVFGSAMLLALLVTWFFNMAMVYETSRNGHWGFFTFFALLSLINMALFGKLLAVTVRIWSNLNPS